MKQRVLSLIMAMVMIIGITASLLSISVSAGNGFASAENISVNKTYHKIIESEEFFPGYDYYKFNLSNNGYISVVIGQELMGDTWEHFYVEIFNDTYESIYGEYTYGNKEKFILPVIGLKAGTYYIGIKTERGETASYNYNLNVQYTVSNNWEKEFNNSYLSATQIKTNTVYYGTSIGEQTWRDSDFYCVKINVSDTYTIKFENPKVGYKSSWSVTLYDAEYNELEKFYVDGNKTNSTITKKLYKGTYYIEVVDDDFDNVHGLKYKISVNTYVPKVSGFKFHSASVNAIRIDWNKVSGATGYVVYRYNSSKKSWIRLGTTTKNTYKDTKLASGTTYKYAVKAYKKVDGKTIYSASYPTVNACTDPGTVSFKLSTSSKKVKASWSKVKGASGYIVYYKTSKNGSWKKLKTTTSTSYTKTSLTKGKTYYFTVKAYKKLDGKSYSGKYVTKSIKVK